MTERDETEHCEPSIGELIRSIAELASTLVRGELALAKIEIREMAARMSAGAALFLVAAFLAIAGIVFLLIALMLLLTPLVGGGLAALIVTVVLFVAAAITANIAKTKFAPDMPKPMAAKGAGASPGVRPPVSPKATSALPPAPNVPGGNAK